MLIALTYTDVPLYKDPQNINCYIIKESCQIHIDGPKDKDGVVIDRIITIDKVDNLGIAFNYEFIDRAYNKQIRRAELKVGEVWKDRRTYQTEKTVFDIYHVIHLFNEDTFVAYCLKEKNQKIGLKLLEELSKDDDFKKVYEDKLKGLK